MPEDTVKQVKSWLPILLMLLGVSAGGVQAYAQLTSRITALEGKLHTLEVTQSHSQGTVAEIKENIRTINAKIDDVVKGVSGLRADVKALSVLQGGRNGRHR